MKSTLAVKLPCALAVAILVASSPAWSAGRIVNLKAVEDDKPYNGFIVRFKQGSAERASVNALRSSIDETRKKLIRNRAIDDSFTANKSRAFALDHVRRLGNDAHLLKPSRKMARAEALATLRELASNPNVEFVEPNLIFTHQMVPNDSLYSQQWGFGSAGINAEPAWDLATGAGITVAVVDTGITSHPDLNANVVAGYDFVTPSNRYNDGNGRDSDPSDPGDACNGASSSWHGTHVSGTIAASTNNGTGVAGVAFGAKVMPVRVLGVCGGELADIADGIEWSSGGAVDAVTTLSSANAAKVINMSLGGAAECPQSYLDAISHATGRGTTVVVAAGNSNQNASGFTPANCPGVITVAAVDSTGTRASFSNYGAKVDIAAPGVGILSTLNTGTTSPGSPTYVNYNGTSMATPHVAGVVALVQSRRQAAGLSLFTPEQIRQLLKATARALPLSGCPEGCGSGIVDAAAATNLAVALGISREDLLPPQDKEVDELP